jgi:hypothetical protein
LHGVLIYSRNYLIRRLQPIELLGKRDHQGLSSPGFAVNGVVVISRKKAKTTIQKNVSQSRF